MVVGNRGDCLGAGMADGELHQVAWQGGGYGDLEWAGQCVRGCSERNRVLLMDDARMGTVAVWPNVGGRVGCTQLNTYR